MKFVHLTFLYIFLRCTTRSNILTRGMLLVSHRQVNLVKRKFRCCSVMLSMDLFSKTVHCELANLVCDWISSVIVYTVVMWSVNFACWPYVWLFRENAESAFLCIEKVESQSQRRRLQQITRNSVDIPGWGQNYPKPLVPSSSPTSHLIFDPLRELGERRSGMIKYTRIPMFPDHPWD